MAEDAQERTEQPTSRRRAKARDEGRIPRSTDLSAAAVILAGGAVLAMGGAASLVHAARRVLVESMASLSSPGMGADGAAGFLGAMGRGLFMAFLPFAAGLVALVLCVNLVQAQGVVSWQPVQPKWSNVDPLAGIRRLWSRDALMNGVKAVIKLAVVAAITYWLLKSTLPRLTGLGEAPVGEIARTMLRLSARFVILMGLVYLAVSGLDYAYQRAKLERDLRMTRQEVRQDLRESEGDPLVKGRILSLARARARQRMLQRVPQADVVVVNPTHVAVALEYDALEMAAPVVVAMGQRKLAQRIRDLARRHDVPVVENVAVARALLATGKVGQTIPPDLYAAVAEILAFVYRRREGAEGIPAALRPRGAA